MCALLFKRVAVPLHACVMLLQSGCAPAAAPNPIHGLPELVRPGEVSTWAGELSTHILNFEQVNIALFCLDVFWLHTKGM